MNKRHCDCCDCVIDERERFLTLKVGTGQGNSFLTEEDEREYCRHCASTEAVGILEDIVHDAFGEAETAQESV
jgi:hypothetical protein